MGAYGGQRLGAATVARGLARGAFEHAVRYAGERRQSGRPIGGFLGLRWLIAGGTVQMLRSAVPDAYLGRLDEKGF